MLLTKEQHDQFFEYIRKRQTVWHNRFVKKLPREEWTDDPILKNYKFCNVFRELDAGTQLVLKNVIDRKDLDFRTKLINVIAYRFFNTRWYFDEIGVFTEFKREEMRDKLAEAKKKYGKVFAPAYLIGPTILNPKERGKYCQVTFAVQYAWENLDTIVDLIKDETDPLKLLKKVRIIPLVGPFLAYQIILDMIYTGEMKVDDNCELLVGVGAVAMISFLTGKRRVRNSKDYMMELYNAQWDYTDNIKNIYPDSKLLKCPRPELYEISVNNIEFNMCEFRKYCKILNNIRGRRKYYKG